MRALLATADDDTLGAYADAIAIAQEISAAEAADPRLDDKPHIQDISLHRSRRWLVPALAAAAIVVIAIPVTQRLRSGPPATIGAAQYAALIPASADLRGSRIWGVNRGESTSTEPVMAIRAGALVVDLGLALQRGDSAAAIASAIADNLTGVSGAASVGTELRAAVARGGPAAADYARIAESVLAAVDRELATGGAWLEAARLHPAAIVDQVSATATLEPLMRRKDLSEQQHASIRQFLTIVNGEPRQPAAIRDGAESLLRELAY